MGREKARSDCRGEVAAGLLLLRFFACGKRARGQRICVSLPAEAKNQGKPWKKRPFFMENPAKKEKKYQIPIDKTHFG